MAKKRKKRAKKHSKKRKKARKAKGKVPLKILERRLVKLNSIVRKRHGDHY